MSFLIMPAAKEPVICETACQHTDCVYWKSLINKPCTVCGHPVTPGETFCYDATPQKTMGLVDDAISHWVCLEEEAGR